jgi:hypothetical protein
MRNELRAQARQITAETVWAPGRGFWHVQRALGSNGRPPTPAQGESVLERRRIAAPALIQLRDRGQRFETLPEPVIRFFSSGSPR